MSTSALASVNSAIYRAVITSKFRTEKMYTFYKSVGDGPEQNTMYISFGKSTPWSANENEPGFAPPYPSDSTDGVVDIWSNMMGAVKVDPSMLDCVIPRRDWGDSRYDNSTFLIGDIVVTNNAPYNKTEVGAGWLIYKCVDVPKEGMCSIGQLSNKDECLALGGKWSPSRTSTIVPRGRADTSGSTNGIIDTGDGYYWEYLYEIPPDVSINRCTNEYIVVPWPEEVAADPQRWGYHNNISWQQYDYDIIYRLKANCVRFKAFLDSVYFPEFSLPGNTGFRQLAVISNPLEAKKNPNDPNVKATKGSYPAVSLFRQSGEIIYMENRQPIIRSMDQTEEVSIVFEF